MLNLLDTLYSVNKIVYMLLKVRFVNNDAAIPDIEDIDYHTDLPH